MPRTKTPADAPENTDVPENTDTPENTDAPENTDTPTDAAAPDAAQNGQGEQDKPSAPRHRTPPSSRPKRSRVL